MIECLLYNLDGPQRELFSFAELTTLEVTVLLDEEIKIDSATIYANDRDTYLGEEVSASFKTIHDFNRFFINNRTYFLNDCDLALENGLRLHSHDDGEVNIYMPFAYRNRSLIKDILRIKGLSENLLEEIMKLPGYYFAIGADGKVTSVHETFDDYLNSGK